jgi:uncharacterized membrane protein YccC
MKLPPGTLQQAARMAAAGTLAMATIKLLGFPASIWAPLSALAVLQAEIGGSLVASRNYLLASATGILIGALTVEFVGDNVLLAGAGIFPIVVLARLLHMSGPTTATAAGVVPVLVLSVSGNPWEYGVYRLADVFVGVVAANLVGVVLWPSRAVVALRRAIAAALGDADSIASGALRDLAAGTPDEGSEETDARAAGEIAAAQGMLASAKGEPLAAPVRELLPFYIAHTERILEHAASVRELAIMPLPQPAVASLSPTLTETAASLDATMAALQAAVQRGAAGSPLPEVRTPAATLRASVDRLQSANLSAWTADAGILTVHSLLMALDILCREIERTIDRIEQPEGAVQPVERAYMAQAR